MSENPNPEPEQNVEPGPQSPDDLTEDQLRDMIDGHTPTETTDEPPAEPIEAPPEEPEQLVAEEAVEVADEPLEEEPAPQSVEDQLAAFRQELELERLRRQAQEERNQHLEFKLSRKAGEVGDLRQRLRTTPPQPAAQDDLGGYQDEPYSPQPADSGLSDEIQGGIEEFRAERFQSAAERQYAELKTANSKFWKSLEGRSEEERAAFQAAWNENLKKEVGRFDEDVAYARQRGDVKMISSIVRAAYGAALADTRADFANRSVERKRTSASQGSALKERKLAAAAGAQGTRPTPRAQPKRAEDATPEELEAEINRRAEAGIFVG